MRVPSLAISLFLSTPLAGLSAASVAPAPVPVAPAPARPILPAPVPPATVPPPVPPQVPQANQPIQSGPTYSEPNTPGNIELVPRYGAQTNAFVAPRRLPMTTNGFAPQAANTNVFGSRTNQFIGGLGSSFGATKGQFGALSNQFNGMSTSGFPFTNRFGTNIVLQDEGLTPHDRVLLAQIRKVLLPTIRRDRLPIHLICQNGMVTLTGFALSTQEARQLAIQVGQTPGVTGVHNQLQVDSNLTERGGSGPGRYARDQDNDDEAFSPADRDLLKDMRSRMRRRRGEHGGSQSVRIIARNGVIILTGFVGSTGEERALLAAAQSTPGVMRVDDDLMVRGQTGQGGTQTPGAALGGSSSPSGLSTGAADSRGVAPLFNAPNQFGGSLTNTNTLPP